MALLVPITVITMQNPRSKINGCGINNCFGLLIKILLSLKMIYFYLMFTVSSLNQGICFLVSTQDDTTVRCVMKAAKENYVPDATHSIIFCQDSPPDCSNFRHPHRVVVS